MKLSPFFASHSRQVRTHVVAPRLVPKDQELKSERAEIGDDVFIRIRVTILKGYRIGSGSVIAVGSVFQPFFETPIFSAAAGNPARIVASLLKENSI